MNQSKSDNMTEETKNNGHLVITNPWQKEQEIKITVPGGYEIDKDNSTFECIRFKKKDYNYRAENRKYEGFEINPRYGIIYPTHIEGLELGETCVFVSEKQAKSARAMAQISQIMANDERFGGPVTDEEWKNSKTTKHTIERYEGRIISDSWANYYQFLAFHTKEQRDLFLEENMGLVKDYLMID